MSWCRLLSLRPRQIAATAPPFCRRPPLLDTLMNLGALRPFVAKKTEATLRGTVRRDHYPAPYAIVDLWQRYGASGAGAYEAEARSISELMCSPSSRNLVRVFLLQDRLKGLGGGIERRFQACACHRRRRHGRRHCRLVGVSRHDGDAAGSQRRIDAAGLGPRQGLFRETPEEIQRPQPRLSRLKMDVKGDGVAAADVVIEAIFENIEAKQSLYATLEPKLKASAILATNTSSISIETLSQKLADPSRLVGIHFFNPVAQLQLVEVVQGANPRARSSTTR